jgi:uncharacterized protein (TIGR01777 family)
MGPMKIVVAGGSGMIGRAVCTELVAAGHETVALTRALDRVRLPGGVRAVEWRPPVLGAWVAELDEADAIVNLTGESIGRWPWTAARKRVLRESRLVPTETLVAAMAGLPTERRPRVLLNISGSDVYEGRDAEPATESTPAAETFLARLCLAWEGAAIRAGGLGVRVVLLRASPVIAPGAASLRVLSLPFRFFLGGRIGSGRQWVSWVDMVDAVGLIRWAIDTEEVRGPLNVAAPDPRRQADFARTLSSVLHRPSRFPTPGWAVRLVTGEQATLALGSRRVWPAKAIAGGYVFRRGRLEDSLSEALTRGRTGPALD